MQVVEFNFLKAQAQEPLSTFLEYITYEYMIENIMMLLKGTLSGRDVNELIEQCHPMVRKRFFRWWIDARVLLDRQSGSACFSECVRLACWYCYRSSWLCVPRVDQFHQELNGKKWVPPTGIRPTIGRRDWEKVANVVAHAEYSSRLV